mmetsp:Transcript_8910/g.13294  ORF Transcript_8910/g.13294 Transcript_8910/m.13294 type:complete len:433 (+) Transcript_8910:57-1355(+)
MYDDLFGDLPMAKKSSAKIDKDATTCSGESSVTKGPESVPTSTSVTSKSLQSNGTGSVNDTNKSKSKSIVQSLGNAGTTVSFVPTALRRKRTSNSNPANLILGGASKKRSSVVGSGTLGVTGGTRVTDVSGVASVSTKKDEREKEKGEALNSLQSISIEKKEQHNHCTSTNDNRKNDGSVTPIVEDEDHATNSISEEYTESKELQKLHSSVHPYDMYDPIEPNDYLTYRQNKENELIRRDLQRQAMKTLELQQQLREHIEEERKKVLESGDVDKIIESRISSSANIGGGIDDTTSAGRGRGRGRGRGLNNLPAWLVNKQKEKERQKENDTQAIRGQFDDDGDGINGAGNDDSGFTVVLTNMVLPGEVDDELKDEVKEECEMKCGKVVRVRIDENRKEVKVFVTFQNKGDATKAPSIFHGRMFGQRQISALLL